MVLRSSECPGCGGDLNETTTKAGRPGDHYEAEAVTCYRCAVREQAKEIHTEQGLVNYGVLWSVSEKP